MTTTTIAAHGESRALGLLREEIRSNGQHLVKVHKVEAEPKIRFGGPFGFESEYRITYEVR